MQSLDLPSLRQLAASQNADADELVEVLLQALTDAYHATAAAHPEARVTCENDGVLRLVDPDGAEHPARELSRIGAAAVRQSLLAWTKDKERRRKVGHWADKENTAIDATVLGPGRNGDIRLDVDGVSASLPAGEQTPEEVLRAGDEIAVLLLAANVDGNDQIRLAVSRRQPLLVTALIARTCPDVAAGRVEVKGVSRDPGHRAKVLLSGPDAIARVVGAGGHRMRAVVDALGGERIDLVEHHDDLATLAAAALTPARVQSATVLDATRKTVQVCLAADQIAWARGEGDINQRLATKLTGARYVFATAD